MIELKTLLDRYPTVEPHKLKALLDLGFDIDYIERMLANVEQTEKTADGMGVRYKETALGMRFKVGDPFEDACASLMAGLEVLHEADPQAAIDLAKKLAGMLPPTQQGKTARDGDLVGWIYGQLERGVV